jgi:DNA-binding response OmpR family regulator
MRGKILIVEDDPLMGDMVSRYLKREGFQVRVARTGEEALRVFDLMEPELVILDLMLPDMDGFELCKRFGDTGSMVLILSARDAEEDRIVGLEIGADDYVTKPFNMRELLARVRALLRRRRKAGERTGVRRVDDFEVREEERRIYLRGRPLPLTAKEYLILRKMLVSRGRVLTREEIIREVYTEDVPDYERIVDTYIYRIRTKIMEVDRKAAERIKTVRGFGYRFE